MATSEKAYIVQATQKDADRLSRLIRNSFADVADRFELTPQNCSKHPSNYTAEWVEKDLARGVNYFILAVKDSPVGCVGVERAQQTTCYMERLAVLPDHRGNGYGTHLAHHALKIAKTMGATSVGIGIIAADTGLKDFYKALGFKEGKTKTFPHLPFAVAFLNILV